MKINIVLVVILLTNIGMAVTTNESCDRSWLRNQAYVLNNSLSAQSIPTPICTTPPDSYAKLEAAQLAAYKSFRGKKNITIDDLAVELYKNNWTKEEMIIAEYNPQTPPVGPPITKGGQAIYTVSQNQYGNWEVNNINLPPRISGIDMPIEYNVWYNPSTKEVHTVSKVVVETLRVFNATA
jgi:hypothetical protein